MIQSAGQVGPGGSPQHSFCECGVRDAAKQDQTQPIQTLHQLQQQAFFTAVFRMRNQQINVVSGCFSSERTYRHIFRDCEKWKHCVQKCKFTFSLANTMLEKKVLPSETATQFHCSSWSDGGHFLSHQIPQSCSFCHLHQRIQVLVESQAW